MLYSRQHQSYESCRDHDDAYSPRAKKRRPLAVFLTQVLKNLRDGEPKRDERYSRSHPPHQGAFMGEIGAFVGEARGSIQRGLFVRRFFVHGRPILLPASRAVGARSSRKRMIASRIATTLADLKLTSRANAAHKSGAGIKLSKFVD